MKEWIALLAVTCMACSQLIGLDDPVADETAGDAMGPLDAMPVPDAGVDTDGDGIVDSVDNCTEVANADQRNHDGDSHGDVCDGCPHVAEVSPADTDADGVGDVCDPRQEGRDRIVRFEGFYEDLDGMPSDWISSDGAASDWRVRGGWLEQTSTAPAVHVLYFNQDLTAQAIDTSVRIDGVAEAGDVTRSVGVVAYDNRSMTDVRRWMCVLHDVGDDDEEPSLNLTDQAGSKLTERDTIDVTLPVAMNTATTFRFRLQRISSVVNAVCAMTGASSPVSTNLFDFGRDGDGAVGLRTNGVAASYDYVVIYDAAP